MAIWRQGLVGGVVLAGVVFASGCGYTVEMRVIRRPWPTPNTAEPTVPDAPTIGVATVGESVASVPFTPPANDGGSAILYYVATSTPEGLHAEGTISPLTITGLTNGVEYTFVVHAVSAIGESAESEASNAASFTPASVLVTANVNPLGAWSFFDTPRECAFGYDANGVMLWQFTSGDYLMTVDYNKEYDGLNVILTNGTANECEASLRLTHSAVPGEGYNGTFALGQCTEGVCSEYCVPESSPMVTVATTAPMVVGHGDSLTAGMGGLSYLIQLGALLSGARSTENAGVTSATFADMTTNAATLVDPLYLASRTSNVVIAWCGTNDLKAEETVEDTLTALAAYCAARQAVGWTVYVMTMLPRSDTGTPEGFEAARQSFNTTLRSTWATFADGIIDVAADARIGDAGDQLNTTYYDTDHVHMTTAGYAVVAAVVYAALEA